jgi:hypothetical protein
VRQPKSSTGVAATLKNWIGARAGSSN